MLAQNLPLYSREVDSSVFQKATGIQYVQQSLPAALHYGELGELNLAERRLKRSSRSFLSVDTQLARNTTDLETRLEPFVPLLQVGQISHIRERPRRERGRFEQHCRLP